jgi:hypothetical protein
LIISTKFSFGSYFKAFSAGKGVLRKVWNSLELYRWGRLIISAQKILSIISLSLTLAFSKPPNFFGGTGGI